MKGFGISDSVATNAAPIRKSAGSLAEVTRDICSIAYGPARAEVLPTKYANIVRNLNVSARTANHLKRARLIGAMS
jgi:transaldolase